MKATGIVRRIDDLGRLVIPKELRRAYQIEEGDSLEIFTDNEGIIIRKYENTKKCVFCGESDVNSLVTYKGVAICRNCLNDIKR